MYQNVRRLNISCVSAENQQEEGHIMDVLICVRMRHGLGFPCCVGLKCFGELVLPWQVYVRKCFCELIPVNTWETEQVTWSGISSALYEEGIWFDSGLVHPYPSWRWLVVFFIYSGHMPWWAATSSIFFQLMFCCQSFGLYSRNYWQRCQVGLNGNNKNNKSKD